MENARVIVVQPSGPFRLQCGRAFNAFLARLTPTGRHTAGAGDLIRVASPLWRLCLPERAASANGSTPSSFQGLFSQGANPA